MRSRASVCGLALSVEAAGDSSACAQFAAALAPHATDAGDAEPLALDLRLLAGLPSNFDRLAVSRAGESFAVRGDGLAGEIGRSRGRLEVFGGGPAALQVAMRLACALWLAPRNGLLLHGASVEVSGRGLALLGASGAGKTTLARRLLSSGVRVIADEVAAVRVLAAEGPRLFGHPLPRRLGDGQTPGLGLPLAAIGLIAHAHTGGGPRAQLLAPAQAARAILQRVFLPAADTALIDGALGCAEALARAVPVYALALPDDARAVPAVLGLLDAPVLQ
jgi:hypothetical protein